jgi:hypothetical protein
VIEGGRRKTESYKCKLHPKNLSVAQLPRIIKENS